MNERVRHWKWARKRENFIKKKRHIEWSGESDRVRKQKGSHMCGPLIRHICIVYFTLYGVAWCSMCSNSERNRVVNIDVVMRWACIVSNMVQIKNVLPFYEMCHTLCMFIMYMDGLIHNTTSHRITTQVIEFVCILPINNHTYYIRHDRASSYSILYRTIPWPNWTRDHISIEFNTH